MGRTGLSGASRAGQCRTGAEERGTPVPRRRPLAAPARSTRGRRLASGPTRLEKIAGRLHEKENHRRVAGGLPGRCAGCRHLGVLHGHSHGHERRHRGRREHSAGRSCGRAGRTRYGARPERVEDGVCGERRIESGVGARALGRRRALRRRRGPVRRSGDSARCRSEGLGRRRRRLALPVHGPCRRRVVRRPRRCGFARLRRRQRIRRCTDHGNGLRAGGAEQE